MSALARRRSWAAQRLPIGGLLVLALLAWAFAIHHGIGPTPSSGARAWWQPRGFLTNWLQATSLGLWIDSPRAGLVAFSLPAALLLVALFATSRSALARTMGLAAVLATLLFLFYGMGETRPVIWGFFGWRGSAVMICTAVVTAAALCAPLLAGSWLKQAWSLRIAAYLPVLAVVVWTQRNVTGTDPRLPFAISPWPVVSFFGIEIGGALIAGLLACVALLLAGVGPLRSRPALALLAIGVALATPLVWVRLHFGTGMALLGAAIVLAAVAMAAAANGRSPKRTPRPPKLQVATRSTAVGALLVAFPILCGDFAVAHDYTVTRSQNAQQIIDALAHYFQREHSYPDSLGELVAAKDLVEIPRPQVGFGGGDEAFTYQNFGASYILEFSAQRWMQCAYNPPWSDDSASAEDAPHSAVGATTTPGDTDEKSASGAREDAGDASDDERIHGAWSCPTKPPELW
ncbi:MAG TPA: hypothetical protein VK714_13815 [Myxococcota bacterium]|nr:hypothetical protein [Myxococcota bacterium]